MRNVFMAIIIIACSGCTTFSDDITLYDSQHQKVKVKGSINLDTNQAQVANDSTHRWNGYWKPAAMGNELRPLFYEDFDRPVGRTPARMVRLADGGYEILLDMVDNWQMRLNGKRIGSQLTGTWHLESEGISVETGVFSIQIENSLTGT